VRASRELRAVAQVLGCSDASRATACRTIAKATLTAAGKTIALSSMARSSVAAAARTGCSNHTRQRQRVAENSVQLRDLLAIGNRLAGSGSTGASQRLPRREERRPRGRNAETSQSPFIYFCCASDRGRAPPRTSNAAKQSAERSQVGACAFVWRTHPPPFANLPQHRASFRATTPREDDRIDLSIESVCRLTLMTLPSTAAHCPMSSCSTGLVRLTGGPG
jgi:hypothetical protein